MITTFFLYCLRSAYRFFELRCGWFFVNGHKEEAWAQYLKKKYGEKADTSQSFRNFFREKMKSLEKK